MQGSRRADLEAKKEKLQELRRLKQAREDARRNPAPSPVPRPRQEVDALVDELLSVRGPLTPRVNEAILGESSPSPSIPTTPTLGATLTPLPPLFVRSGAGSRTSDAGSELNGGESTIQQRFIPDLIDIEQELFELPRKERVIYSKEVQTVEAATEPSGPSESEIRARIQREQDAERAAAVVSAQEQKLLEEENAKLDKEIEEETRELTEEERSLIFSAPEFLEFVEHSSKILQRALSDNYDYIRDYTIGTETNLDDSAGRRVKRICTFTDKRWTHGRSITDIDWSPKYPELTAASYNKNVGAPNDPSGIVCIWNLHLLERPEFVFHAQSDVLCTQFSPFHPNLIFGGTYSGQILLWDTRAKQLPILKSPLSASGHTHPVYAMEMIGTQNANNLVTASTDGMVCTWLTDMFAKPQETLELVHTGHNKTDEVAITSLDFPSNETQTFWVGTEEGNVYQAHRYDRAGSKAGLYQNDIYKSHSAPVTGIHFHTTPGPVDFSDLFLTCSMDWTVKLWRAKPNSIGGSSSAAAASATAAPVKPSSSLNPGSGGIQMVQPLYSFEEADDYVYDVKWHPNHPALFGTVDGSGKFDLWNLNIDTEVPVDSTLIGNGRAVNKLAWDVKDGRRVALGASDGDLHIYDIGDAAVPRETEWADLQRSLTSMLNVTAAGSGAGPLGGGFDGLNGR